MTDPANRRVRFTQDHLGLLDSPHDPRFNPDETANKGDLGEYIGVHPTIEGWHIIRVGELFCPCAPSMFEFVQEP